MNISNIIEESNIVNERKNKAKQFAKEVLLKHNAFFAIGAVLVPAVFLSGVATTIVTLSDSIANPQALLLAGATVACAAIVGLCMKKGMEGEKFKEVMHDLIDKQDYETIQKMAKEYKSGVEIITDKTNVEKEAQIDVEYAGLTLAQRHDEMRKKETMTLTSVTDRIKALKTDAFPKNNSNNQLKHT